MARESRASTYVYGPAAASQRGRPTTWRAGGRTRSSLLASTPTLGSTGCCPTTARLDVGARRRRARGRLVPVLRGLGLQTQQLSDKGHKQSHARSRQQARIRFRLSPPHRRTDQNPATNMYVEADSTAGDSANPELDSRRSTEADPGSGPGIGNGAIEAPIIFRQDGSYYLWVSWERAAGRGEHVHGGRGPLERHHRSVRGSGGRAVGVWRRRAGDVRLRRQRPVGRGRPLRRRHLRRDGSPRVPRLRHQRQRAVEAADTRPIGTRTGGRRGRRRRRSTRPRRPFGLWPASRAFHSRTFTGWGGAPPASRPGPVRRAPPAGRVVVPVPGHSVLTGSHSPTEGA